MFLNNQLCSLVHHILEASHPLVHSTFALLSPDISLSISTCFEQQHLHDKKLATMPTWLFLENSIYIALALVRM